MYVCVCVCVCVWPHLHLQKHKFKEQMLEIYFFFQDVADYSNNGASQVAQWVKNQSANVGDVADAGSIPGLGRSPGGKSHGQRSLEGYSPWGRKESDMTE